MFKVTAAALTPAAGQLYKTPAGKLRLLVVTTDGREAVMNPATGRLLAHGETTAGKPRIFTTWADRVAEDGYTFVGTLGLA